MKNKLSYRDVKKKRDRLRDEINELNVIRFNAEAREKGVEINNIRDEKKKKFNFYDSLMKTIGKGKW